MKAVLVLAHGSRNKETEQVLNWILEGVQAKAQIALIEGAFLQFSEKDLEAGIVALKEKGATDITIVPYFLFEGVHITEDIPEEIEKMKAKYPELHIQLGQILGADMRLVDILVDRIAEAV